MQGKTIVIFEAVRTPEFGTEDRLLFVPGVNVIVGPPNTGKSKWFTMLDFLFGRDETAEGALGEDLTNKYESVAARVLIGAEEHLLERRWTVPGAGKKIYVDDVPYSIKDFWEFIMAELEIPVVHYPRGNPLGPKTWPELSWRSLLRQIYRRQLLWTDFADKQFPSEQHAVLVQFLGLAKYLFSKEYSDLVNNQKKVVELQTAKDQFVEMLQNVSKEILDPAEALVAITPESIDRLISRVELEITALEENRNVAIAKWTEVRVPLGPDPKSKIQAFGEKQAQLNIRREALIKQISETESRLEEMRAYRTLVENEEDRMKRAVDAGEEIADLRVTNCPVCDQTISPKTDIPTCYLCHRHKPESGTSVEAAKQRLEFELEQLAGDLLEADQLVKRLEEEIVSLRQALAGVDRESRRVQSLLRSTRSPVAAVLPSEVLITDVEIGRLHERREQLIRIKKTLEGRELISDRILEIQKTVNDLERKVVEQGRELDFETLGDEIGDGMNDYLNRIRETATTSWSQGQVSFRLNDRYFTARVGGERWDRKLGGTLTYYFLLAYHYALMRLTPKLTCNYPGLLLLDFPAEIEDAASIADKENFVLDPFVELLSRPDMELTQVIAGGSSFENLEGANRIELTKIWK